MQLFDDFSINNIHFKNRILISLPVRNNAKRNGALSSFIIDNINRLIRGGVGTIILDSVCISSQGKSHSLQLEINEEYISGFRSLVRHVKEEGVVLGIRLTHCGAKTSRAICGEKPVSSSAINFGKDFDQSYPFDDYGAEEIVLNFKHAAEQAEESGFEIIELNGGSQELLEQCFNLKFNQRQDEYGGCLKNRLNMLKDIIATIKTRLQGSLLSYYFPVNRAKKITPDYLYQNRMNEGKLNAVEEICKKENISFDEVAYIGDDINDKELLEMAGFSACPKNATSEIKKIPNIIRLEKNGGDGAVREFIEIILRDKIASV